MYIDHIDDNTKVETRFCLNANQADSLSVSTVGSSKNPVYFEEGVPFACVNTFVFQEEVESLPDLEGTDLYVKKTGSTMTGNLTAPTFTGNLIGNADSASSLDCKSTIADTKYYILGKPETTEGNSDVYFAYNSSGSKNTAGIAFNGSTGVLSGAAWNDYAEYRICKENFKPGQVVCENGDDTLSISQYRLQPGAEIISDTYGFIIGETDEATCPIAVSGRVLAYPFEPRELFKPGDAVCAGPNGTVSIMTRKEICEYPERIIGTVSAIPNYKVWGINDILVDNRIWIRIR